jgi:hypothetical protein
VQTKGNEEGAEFVKISARAGEVALRLGICAGGGLGRKGRGEGEGEGEDDGEEDEDEGEENENSEEELREEEKRVREMGAEVVKACQGMGGTLEGVGEILDACLSSEVIKAK